MCFADPWERQDRPQLTARSFLLFPYLCTCAVKLRELSVRDSDMAGTEEEIREGDGGWATQTGTIVGARGTPKHTDTLRCSDLSKCQNGPIRDEDKANPHVHTITVVLTLEAFQKRRIFTRTKLSRLSKVDIDVSDEVVQQRL